MADHDDDSDGTEGFESQSDAFMASIESRFGDRDQADLDREDGMDVGEGDEEGTTSEDEDDSTEEHPKAGTSADGSDGSAAGSGEDSEETDDSEDPDASGSDDDDEADDEDDAGEDEDGLDDETKAALEKHGATLTLDDVPKEYRPLVEAKLKNVQSAFTRAMQEATAFRATQSKVEAEEAFRAENPDLFIAEMLLKDPDLIERVQARIDKAEDPDQKKVFDIITKDARREAAEKVVTARTEYEAAIERGNTINAFAKAQAQALGLPWRLAERAIEADLLRKPVDKVDITEAEVTRLLKLEAAEYTKESRKVKRETSKELVKERTKVGKTAVPAKRPAGAVPPRPKAEKVTVDFNSEESRHNALMRSMRKIKPGAGATK